MLLRLRRVETKLDRVLAILGHVERDQIIMANEFADAEAQLLAQVAESVTMQGSVLVFLESLEAQLTSAMQQDPQNVLKALKSLKDSSAALAANLLANTPHDPVPAPVVVAPVEEPAPAPAPAPAPVAVVPDPVVVAPVVVAPDPVPAPVPVVVADPVVAVPVEPDPVIEVAPAV